MTVNVVSAQVRGVLAVPVSALVALAGGGYALEVVHGSAASLVAVHTGLFSDTLVQVSGAGLAAGRTSRCRPHDELLEVTGVASPTRARRR